MGLRPEGRGAAALGLAFKIEDGSVQDKTFRAGEKFRPVRTETRRMQYLYDSGDAGGLLYYVMPLVIGESLRALGHAARAP